MKNKDRRSTLDESADGAWKNGAMTPMEEMLGRSSIWISDVDFWLDEAEYFEGSLLKMILEDRLNGQLPQANDLLHRSRYFQEEVLRNLKSSVYEHRQSLLMLDREISEELLDTNRSIMLRINATESSMRDYKDEYMQIKKESMERQAKEAEHCDCMLIPTDFSENATKAIDYAFSILGKAAERIILLHVISDLRSLEDKGISLDEAMDAIRAQQMNAELERLRAGFPDLLGRVSHKIVVGKLSERLTEILEKIDIDLIVMGTKGMSDDADSFFGSNTSRVISELPLPVLVVPKETPLLPPQHILFTTDLELDAPPKGIGILEEIQRRYKSNVDVLHIEEPNKGKLESAHDRVEREVSFSHVGLGSHEVNVLQAEDKEECIRKYVADKSMDMVVMTTRNGGLFHRLFHRSLTKSMVLHSHTPVLVLKEH